MAALGWSRRGWPTEGSPPVQRAALDCLRQVLLGPASSPLQARPCKLDLASSILQARPSPLGARPSGAPVEPDLRSEGA